MASRGRRLSCSLSTHPNAVHNGGCFALCGLWVPNEVIPGTKYPPAEGVIFIGSTGQAGARVLSHSAREAPVSHRSGLGAGDHSLQGATTRCGAKLSSDTGPQSLLDEQSTGCVLTTLGPSVHPFPSMKWHG